MRCPSCGYEDSKVVDSRPAEEGVAIRRRRECLECGYRFTTYERLGENPIIVIKADGSSEAFEKEKMFRGILVACAKRPVSSNQITEIVNDIEAELRSNGRYEIRSKELGEMILSRLIDVDEVSFVRFASVYRDFQDAEEFARELETLR